MPVKLLLKNPKLKAWLLLRHTYYSVVKCEDELYSQTGLTSQQLAVLMAIKQAPDPVTQTDIANWLDRDNTSITLMIDRLSREGLVERVRDLKDRRSVRLVMTPKGEEIFRKAKEPTVQQIQDIMSCLTEKEIKTVCIIMEKLLDKSFEYRNVKDKVKEIAPNSNSADTIPWPDTR